MKAIYPGTFDPITFGHIDLIERGLKIFDEMIVAVAVNPMKQPLLSIEDRLWMVEESIGKRPRVTIETFDCLLIDYARRKKTHTILRGLRAVSDFEYEMQIALTTRKMNPELETVFMMPSKKYIYLSSRIVREIASYGGNIDEFVPPPVVSCLRKKFGHTGTATTA